MVAIAIYSADPVLRCSLEQLLGENPAITIVGVADNPSAILRLIEQNHVDAVLADSPPHEQLADWQTRHDETAFVVLIDGCNDEDSLDALYAGARGILPRSAKRNEIVVAIKAVTNGLAVLPCELLPTLLNGASMLMDYLTAKRSPRTANTSRVRSACSYGRRCLKQSDRTSIGNLLSHRQVSRRRHSRKTQCGQPD